MLDAFIIDELKKERRRKEEREKQPVLEIPLPLDEGRPEPKKDTENKEDSERGVVIIDFSPTSRIYDIGNPSYFP